HRDLAVEIARELDRVLREHGLCGYMKHWYTAPFPLYEYFRLRMLLDRSPLVQQIESEVRAGRSAASLELQLLLTPPELDAQGLGVAISLAPYEGGPSESGAQT
ncbi:MAG: hypothetical protein K8E66_08260, partial [Phycisphaerales bacterium]|nr:hypothetical protein [Phycisphaerales bacterium]